MARGSLTKVAKLLDRINDTDVPVEQQFLFDLTKSIELTAKESARKPSRAYKPSGMNCVRASYYEVTGIEVEDEGDTVASVGITESGTDRHIRIQQAIDSMKNNGFDCEYIDVETFIKQRNLIDLEVVEKGVMETKCFNKLLNMRFLTDGIIRYKGKYYIFEFKTEISNKWWSRTGVDPKHYNQAISYSLNFGLDNVIFVYENRDNCQKKAYLFHVTNEMKHDILGYISTCDTYVAQKQVPPKPNVDNKVCQYCKYRKECTKDGG